MSVRAEIEFLAKYCKGIGLNIGCGNVAIGNSIGVDVTIEAKAAIMLADAFNLPFMDCSLDYIVSAACLEHIDKGPVTVLREWLRCLKVGGTIAVTVPDAEYGMWAMTGDTGKVGQFAKARREMEHLHAFTQTTLMLLFDFAGMQIIRCEKIDRKPVRPETTLLCVGRKTEAYIP